LLKLARCTFPQFSQISFFGWLAAASNGVKKKLRAL
jgi:hypothetical protein